MTDIVLVFDINAYHKYIHPHTHIYILDKINESLN